MHICFCVYICVHMYIKCLCAYIYTHTYLHVFFNSPLQNLCTPKQCIWVLLACGETQCSFFVSSVIITGKKI